MPNWLKLADALVDTGGEVVKALVLDQIHRGALTTRPQVTSSSAPIGETPPGHGCPFCAVGRHLASAHRYLLRTRVNPDMSELYRHLAFLEAQKAATELNIAGEAMPGTPGLELSRRVINLSVALSKPLSQAEIEVLVTEVWDVGERAWDVAEGRNVKPGHANGGRPCIQGEYRSVI